jgi:hypothetical protein
MLILIIKQVIIIGVDVIRYIRNACLMYHHILGGAI